MKSHVLLVEDNPDDELLLVRALHKVDPELAVHVARDGQECIDLLSQAADQPLFPAVVLLDLKLPKLDGISVLRQIRKKLDLPCLPVVVFSSSDEEFDLVQSYASGANGYVCKPDSFAGLLDAVRAMAIYWLSTNRVPSR